MEEEKKKPPKGQVKSFFSDNTLSKRIEAEAAKQERTESFIIRLFLRKAFGMKESGLIQ